MSMLTEHTVAAAAAAAGIGAPARFVEVTGSTNSDLWALAEGGAPEWTLLVARRQQSGRGRLGRTWVSAPGTSLHASVLLRPTLDGDAAPLLTLAAGVAAAWACREAGGVNVGCKWPNDLIAGGRKLGGILTEASVERAAVGFVVIGTGLNVSQAAEDFPKELRDTATSIAREGGRADAAAILERYLVTLRELYGEGGRELGVRVLGPYRQACVTIGRRVRAISTSGGEVEGLAAAVGDGGELWVETAGGDRRAVGFGEIQHLE
jgi:BirA family transcriptional regulator, biotin operon repressor / biotin---[acetyl-CoA-carboxylase] ligase